MFTCPFCSTEIEEGLSRFGGNCPHCFNVIPGEEAPTDPGISVSPSSPKEEDGGSGKTLLVLAFVAVVGVGVAVGMLGSAAKKRDSEELQAQQQAELAAQLEQQENARLAAQEAELAEAEAKEALKAEEAKQQAAEETQRQQRAQRLAQASRSTSTVPSDPSPDRAATPEVVTPETIRSVTTPLSTGPVRESIQTELSTPEEINRAVRSALRRYKGRLNQCYDKQLVTDDGLRGTWQVAFTVEKDGTTSGVRVSPMGVSNSEFESCMDRQVRSWTFPRISEPHPYIKEYSFSY